MGARAGLSIFDLLGASAATSGALKVGIKGSSRNKMKNAIKESVEDSVTAVSKGKKGGTSVAGKNAGSGSDQRKNDFKLDLGSRDRE